MTGTTTLAATTISAAVVSAALAQGEPVNGIRAVDLRTHAIVGARVVVGPGETIEQATIVIRDGLIVAVDPAGVVPDGARVWPGDGLTVYAGLIDAAIMVEAEALPETTSRHWNPRVHPELRMSEQAAPSASVRDGLRKLGFTAAAVYPSAGIFRGSGKVVALGDDAERQIAYEERAAQALSFQTRGGYSNPSYPGSLMGAIALVRQTLHDAAWHAHSRQVYAAHPEANEPPAPNDALAALDDVMRGEQAVLFETASELNAMRAAKLGREFGLDMILLGTGLEFRRLEEVAATELPIIVPLSYPKRPDLSSIPATDAVSLRDMMTWEQAPTNPRRFVDAGVTIALTTNGLKSRNEFPAAVRKAIRHGLSEDAALAALTTTPAGLLGLDQVMGTVEPGKLANLLVVEGDLFDKKAKIRATWINGRRHEISAAADAVFAAAGKLRTDGDLELEVEIDTGKKTAVFHRGEDDKTKTKAKKVVVLSDQISMVVDGRPFDTEGYVQLSGAVTDGVITGTGVMPEGEQLAFTVTADRAIDSDADDQEDEDDETATSRPAEVVADDAGDEEPEAAGGPAGRWSLTAVAAGGGFEFNPTLTIEGSDDDSYGGEMSMRGESRDISNVTFAPGTGSLEFDLTTPMGELARFSVVISGDRLTGTLTSETMSADITGSREAAAAADAGDDDEDFVMPPAELVSPLGAFGRSAAPVAEAVLLRNATIWTCDDQGLMEDADMMVVGGKIRAIGRDLPTELLSADVRVIDLAGKHVTPGLIDCHSHTGISGGVNEFAQTNTAEVRIGDVVNPDDVNWYRQLAGGLTACNQLHGSANPIGGQNSVVKLKWGGGVADYPVEDAIPGIKFALGENVKRSSNRYPNTRMGVETFIRDAFTAARQYQAEWERYRSLSESERDRSMPPRRDMEMETLIEIMNGQRLVHCHSYRQDEILMLVRVADDFGFTIGTFQHVLEGYKVADAIAAHGAGASSFSDWWAYKVEVMDAIPHNGALMTDVGVVVSFNSDSSELARRMNTEAAKAVRYGGLDPHDALKLVTLNPARQLRIDERTGSLAAGKDADFVVWSGPPLSTFSRCEQTWIEGARYFDIEEDRALRANVQVERQRLIQKVLAMANGRPKKTPEARAADAKPAAEFAWLDEGTRRWMEEQVRMGLDPFEGRPGECGCGGVHAHR